MKTIMSRLSSRLLASHGASDVTGGAALLVIGRVIGFVASFAIGIVLARLFTPASFGTYKQFFLLYATLYGLAQFGMAESLYYFVPRNPSKTGRYACNALIALALAGVGCTLALWTLRDAIASKLSNAPLAGYMWLAGLFLTFMLMSTVLEIVMVSRKKHLMAAITYACSDIVRTLFFIVPALLFVSLRAVFLGATIFAALRLVLLLGALWRQYGREFRMDAVLLKEQLAYALPFALAVGVEVIQTNYHQYIVAARFDAATFAIYAVGCLQIPLVDMIMTSTVNVMMVRMAEDTNHGDTTVKLWHETICQLAFLMVPLAIFLFVIAHPLIVTLYTTRYLASVPIFMVWSLTILPSIFGVNAVLRVYAQTRFLLAMNLLRLGTVAVLIGWFLSAFGMSGAVLVTLVSTTLVTLVGVGRIAQLLHLSFVDSLPWSRLTGIFARAIAAALPVVWLTRELALTPILMLGIGSVVYGAIYFGFEIPKVARLKADAPADGTSSCVASQA
jgi:O-antigen/teichoic acid export membrane protein